MYGGFRWRIPSISSTRSRRSSVMLLILKSVSSTDQTPLEDLAWFVAQDCLKGSAFYEPTSQLTTLCHVAVSGLVRRHGSFHSLASLHRRRHS